MLAIGVDFGGLTDLSGAITRGRAAAMPLIARWIANKIRENIAAQRDPWGRGWRPKSRNSDGGQGPALLSMASRVREESTPTSWNVVIDDPNASTHNFGRAKKGTRSGRSRGFRGAAQQALRSTLTNREAGLRGVGTAARGNSGEPPRAMLPLRVRNSGRQEPLVDMPAEWTAETNRILNAEIQREINALRNGTARSAAR